MVARTSRRTFLSVKAGDHWSSDKGGWRHVMSRARFVLRRRVIKEKGSSGKVAVEGAETCQGPLQKVEFLPHVSLRPGRRRSSANRARLHSPTVPVLLLAWPHSPGLRCNFEEAPEKTQKQFTLPNGQFREGYPEEIPPKNSPNKSVFDRKSWGAKSGW